MILIFSVNLQSAGFWGLHYVSVATDAAWRQRTQRLRFKQISLTA
jgi:hypothetical protein